VSFDIAEYEHRLTGFWSDIQGHMQFLKETAEGYAKPTVIELGVRSGQSTSAFLAGIAGNGGELWSCDVDQPSVPAHWHDLPQWHLLVADDVGVQAREWLPAACDILFIDTSHEFRHTVTELFFYVPRVKPGGVVLMHDTEWAPAGNEQLAEPGGPVAEALDAYCGEAGRSWVNRAGSYGMGAIWL
jgi:predicted O-methyltransferase YrrM